MNRRGAAFFITDEELDPEQKLLISVFYQARVDLLSSRPSKRLSAELFFRGCDIDPEMIRRFHNVATERIDCYLCLGSGDCPACEGTGVRL